MEHQVEEIEQVVAAGTALQGEDDPLQFIGGLYGIEEALARTANLTAPTLKPKWTNLPKVDMSWIGDSLRAYSLKAMDDAMAQYDYADSPYGMPPPPGGFGSMFFNDY